MHRTKRVEIQRKEGDDEGTQASSPRQFATRYFVLYVGWTFDFIPVV